MTATAVGHLVRAGLLVYLGGEMATPDIHPDQVAALARRRDLPALLDRHALPCTAPGTQCACARQACGGLIPVPYCTEHGRTAEPAMEWHPAGGIRCTHLTRPAPRTGDVPAPVPGR
ncbi:hypothetical protein ACFUT3_31530 [Streptomyces cinereoruber]|uniref:hypothetical protein n=1 Tax=Streptomyces cinereoruber TaxID=67260 RepID=UPI0036442882